MINVIETLSDLLEVKEKELEELKHRIKEANGLCKTMHDDGWVLVSHIDMALGNIEVQESPSLDAYKRMSLPNAQIPVYKWIADRRHTMVPFGDVVVSSLGADGLLYANCWKQVVYGKISYVFAQYTKCPLVL